MPSSHTTNYQLSQWERTDKIQMDDFNADNAKIDEALAGLAGQVARKAAQSAVSALSQTVSGHTAELAKKGNCRIDTQSYHGTDKYGAEHPTVLTFSGQPTFFLVFGQYAVIFGQNGAPAVSLYNGGYSYATVYLHTTWNGSSVSFYGENSTQQANRDFNYYVVAFYSEDKK